MEISGYLVITDLFSLKNFPAMLRTIVEDIHLDVVRHIICYKSNSDRIISCWCHTVKSNLLSDDVRLTKFGRMLRTTSLDELPELINMLKGDMAVVGPRPLLVRYLPLYNEHQARRHEVRPGFTGYAQVHGRNAISWEEKFDKDVYYVDHISFLGDWKIIFQTVKTVLKREGISSENSATMEEFRGTSIEKSSI